MKVSEIIQMTVIGSALIGGAFIAITQATGSSDKDKPVVTVDVKVPGLSATANRGKTVFDKSCASCHGGNASGTKSGPPLVHDIYNPGHHGDQSFYRAVTIGVKQHHWPYGDMPPRPEVTKRDMSNIIAYVRELQQANGIVYKAHRM